MTLRFDPACRRRQAIRRPAIVPVPDPDPEPDPGPVVLAAPSGAALDKAHALSLRRWYFHAQPGLVSDDTGGARCNTGNRDLTALVTIALAARAGVTTLRSGRTPAQRLIEQLEDWAAGRLPGGLGGYAAQYEIHFVATVAIARTLPDIWGALSEQTRRRLRLGMLACLVGSAWDVSTRAAFRPGGGSQLTGGRSVPGYMVSTNASNFSYPPLMIPHLVAAFEGAAATQSFMETFSRATFAAALASEWAAEIAASVEIAPYEAYRRDHGPATWLAGKGGVGPGPTAAQLEFALRSWTDYSYGATILAPAPVIQGELERFFSKQIRPGVQVTGWSPSQEFGIWNPWQEAFAGVLVDPADWDGLPGFDPISRTGLTGLPFEYDASDAGGQSGASMPHNRSAASYVQDGLNAVVASMLAFAAQGLLTRGAPALAEGFARMGRGAAAHWYFLDHGYRNYSHGGGGGVNPDTGRPYWTTAQNVGLFSRATRYDAWNLVYYDTLMHELLLPWWTASEPEPEAPEFPRAATPLLAIHGGSGHSLWDTNFRSGAWSGNYDRMRESLNPAAPPTLAHVEAGSFMAWRWQNRPSPSTGGDLRFDSRMGIDQVDFLTIVEAGAYWRPDDPVVRAGVGETLTYLFNFVENTWLNARTPHAETVFQTMNTYTGGVPAWGTDFSETLVEYERCAHFFVSYVERMMKAAHPEVGESYRIPIIPLHRFWIRIAHDIPLSLVPGVSTLEQLFPYFTDAPANTIPDDIHPGPVAG